MRKIQESLFTPKLTIGRKGDSKLYEVSSSKTLLKETEFVDNGRGTPDLINRYKIDTSKSAEILQKVRFLIYPKSNKCSKAFSFLNF